MEATHLSLKGLILLKPKIFRDQRGFFLETFQQSVYEQQGITIPFVQDNHSYSCNGCLRGMHYQSIPGQGKLVRVAVGKIFDVAVDIRPHSATYGLWEGVVLDDHEHHQLYIPAGFAHGFCVLSDAAHVLYKVTSPYDPQTERGFRWDDPTIKIEWPIKSPLVSERDQRAPWFEK